MSNLVLDKDALAGVDVSDDVLTQELLTPDAKRLLGEVLEIISKLAADQGVAVARVDIRGYESWEEGTKQLVLTQWVHLQAEGSFAYWDTWEEPIQAWIDQLSEEDREFFWRGFSARVDWAGKIV